MTTTQVPDSAAPDGATQAETDQVEPHGRRVRRGKLIMLGLALALVAVVGLVWGWYLINRKPLSQLPGMSSDAAPHYAFSIYGVSRPLGVAVSPSGERIYVTESDGARAVRVYDRSGKPTGTLKPPGSAKHNWHTPVYVAINPKTQDVYVSDRLASAIYVYAADGTYLRTFDPPKAARAGGWAPLGLAFGPDGSLYVTDIGTPHQQVLVFAPDGSYVRAIGAGDGLSFPNGIVVDKHGRIDVCDSNNGRLLVFNQTGQVVAAINRGLGDGDLGLPRGAAIDDTNRLYVVDTTDHMVRIYRTGDTDSPMPKYVTSFGTEGQLDGTFEYPNGVATDNRARIYVTDRENNRVQVWSY
jgi:DNA-binding beta-propeller fold protein YncE